MLFFKHDRPASTSYVRSLFYDEDLENLVRTAVADLGSNEEVCALVDGYIISADPRLFLDGQYISYYEYSSFYLTNCEYNKVNKIEALPMMVTKYAWPPPDSGNICQTTMLHQKKDTFDVLVGIISEMYDFVSSSHAIFSVYRLIWIKAYPQYLAKAREELAPVFKGYEPADISEYVQIFRNHTADVIDEISIGNVSYYIKSDNGVGSDVSFLDVVDMVKQEIAKQKSRENIEGYRQKLKAAASVLTAKRRIHIDDVDIMSGQEFEVFICNMFQKMGYAAEITAITGDQGIDVIALRPGLKIGIQAKCYNRTVSNSAVQEVVAGGKHYSCDKVIVATNNFFTESAIALASTNNVILWDRSILKEKINELF